jgi:hypothetical protein
MTARVFPQRSVSLTAEQGFIPGEATQELQARSEDA